MDRIKTFLKKRVDLPSSKEILCILRNLSSKEKIFFFVFSVIFIVSALVGTHRINNFFLEEIPASGGSFREGVVGTPRFINPILAISDADHAMTSLIYAGLLRSDNKGNLILDLAEKFKISEDGLVYTFTLKDNLEWQDGEAITSDDIIFTIQQAKNPSVKSPKRATWEGVTIEKTDERTIQFFLRKPYTPFLENATMGILPKHIWKSVPPEQMILSEFNIKPIGNGPYKIKNMNRNSSGIISSYSLVANDKFNLGKPYITNIDLHFYPSEEEIVLAYQNGEINNISAIAPQTAEEILKTNSEIKTLSLPRAFGVFFNQNNAEIFSQKEVRLALNYATDKDRIVNDILQGFGVKLDYPIPLGSFGALQNKSESEFSQDKARKVLEDSGWKLIDLNADRREEAENKKEKSEEEGKENAIEEIPEDLVWEKKTKKKEVLRLEFSIATSDTPDLKRTAELLKSMWEEIGAKVNLNIFEIGDLNQNIIRPRKYQALLFGEIVGREPDPFAFWHSSQRNDPGLNIAMYANITVDDLLEKARVTFDAKQRKEKYEKFQEEVANDVAAIFLYSPRFIYIVPKTIKGLNKIENITIPSERFSQVYRWYIKTNKIWKIFAR